MSSPTTGRGAVEPPVRRVEVGISVEALLGQWARQDAGPAGAAVVVESEVAARRRGGIEWRASDALAVGVLARPPALAPDRAELGWLAASLAAAGAADRLRGGTHACRWPDGIDLADDPPGADIGGLEVAVGSVAGLGPGRVEYLGLVVRVAPVAVAGPPPEVEAALIDGLRLAATALDRPDDLVKRYRARCSTLGRLVGLRLLPDGSTRGLAVAVDERAALVVESETGFRQTVAVSALATIHHRP